MEVQVQLGGKEVNILTSKGAQSFSQNFAINYFDWQDRDEGMKQRIEQLQAYHAIGLDEQAEPL